MPVSTQRPILKAIRNTLHLSVFACESVRFAAYYPGDRRSGAQHIALASRARMRWPQRQIACLRQHVHTCHECPQKQCIAILLHLQSRLLWHFYATGDQTRAREQMQRVTRAEVLTAVQEGAAAVHTASAHTRFFFLPNLAG